MKKGLVVAAVLVACAFGFTGAALAAEISTSGTIEMKLTGTSEDGQASGLFGAGDVLVDYSVTLTSGTFEANLTPEFDLTGTEMTFDDAYIKWSPDTLSVTMKPLGIDKELYDIEGNGGKPNIPDNPGIGIEVPVAPFTFDLVANNVAVGDDAVFSYGFGVKYALNGVTLEGLFGNTDVEAETWYGSYYGAQVTAALDSLTIVGQYGTFSPEAAGLEDGSGYFAKFEYALGEGLGTVALEYTGVDKNLNGAGTPTDKEYYKIYGEYSYPLTDAVSLTLDVANIEPGTPAGAESYTEYEVVIGVSL
jgi:hypothetical protein